MANPIPVQLVVSGDTTNLASQLAKIQDQIRGINGGGSGGMFDSSTKSAETFQQSLRGLIGRFSALWAVLKAGEGIGSLFNVGVQFNSAIENSRLGIASLITAQAKVFDGSGKQLDAQQSLNAAMAMGDDQIQKLRISGLQTAATTEQLVSAYQDAVGGGLRAGMSLDQIRLLTVQTVQAAGAMGVPMNQLNQEIRSILDGTIDRNSRVAIRLGITNADVEKWKQAGTLFEKLNERMAAFSLAGKESMNNWTVLLSNMAEASQILLGDAFKSPMKNIQTELNKVMETIINIDTANISDKVQPVMTMLKDLGSLLGDFAVGTIRAISSAIMSMGQWWSNNRVAIAGTVAAFKVFLGDALTFLGSVAVAFIRYLADSFLWFTKLPEALKAASVAAGMFIAALVIMNSQLAITAGAGIASMITKLQSLGTVLAYTSEFGMAGLTYATAGLLNPVTLAIAGVAALAAGGYYLATSGTRAAQTLLEVTRQSAELTTALIQLAPTLKDVDDQMKQTKLTDEQKIARDKLKAQAVEDLIKLAPMMEDRIRSEVAEGRKLADVWKEVAEWKIKNIQSDAAMLRLKIANDERDFKSAMARSEQNREGGGGFQSIKDTAYIAYYTTFLKEGVDLQKKALGLLDDEVKTLDKKLATEKMTAVVKANTVESDKKKKEADRQAHALAELKLLVDKADLLALEKATDAEKEALEIKKAQAHTEQLILQSKGLAEAAKVDPEKYRGMLITAGENEITRIKNEHLEKRRVAQERWDDFMEGQEGNTLQRKLTALKKLVNKEADNAELILGIKISAAEREKVLAERTERETLAAQQADVKKLEAALVDLEKTKGRALTFPEQIVGLYQLAGKLKIAGAAVDELKDKLTEKNQNKANWYAGMRAGLLEAAQTVETSFTRMQKLVKSVADGMRSAFSNAIQGILSGTMTLSQGLKSLWKGISDTIIKAVADMAAQFLVAQIAQLVFVNTTRVAAGAGAAAAYELAVMESWAAYAGIPFYGVALAMAQIGLITATYAGVKGMSMASGGDTPSGGGTAVASEGMNYAGYAAGGLITRPGFVAENPYSRELVAPESTFLDWIKNIGNPAVSAPMGNYRNNTGGELAFAGGGSVHASFDGAMIIGDSVEGLRKAASALRKIKTYDDRVNA